MTATKVSATDISSHAGTWTLDPDRSGVTFRTKAMWVMPVRGKARVVAGSATVGVDGGVQGSLTIDARSIETGIAKRDQHLQTADFLDTSKYPVIEFTLKGVGPGAAGIIELTGDLEVHGQRNPVTLAATASVEGGAATVVATLDDLDRRKWGIGWTKMGAGVHNKVEVTAVFTRHP